MIDVSDLKGWLPPEDWFTIATLDVHTEGEPLRIVLDGLPALEGKSIFEKSCFFRDHFDHLRTLLMWEPRGHNDMYGALIVEPDSNQSDFGVVFIHNEGYSTGCGHAVLALTKTFVETGLIKLKDDITPVVIDTPSGTIHAEAISHSGQVKSARFRNIPSFVQLLDGKVNVQPYGPICFDVAFGGAFYAFVKVHDIDIKIIPEKISSLISAGMVIKQAIASEIKMDHPEKPEMNNLYGIIFVEESNNPDCHSRQVCVFANGQVDRCPTGTGVSARLSILYERNEIDVNEVIAIDSIIGTIFTGQVLETLSVSGQNAIIPEVGGKSYIIGKQTFIIDPDDPFKEGFILR